jgi:hypothetical protein
MMDNTRCRKDKDLEVSNNIDESQKEDPEMDLIRFLDGILDIIKNDEVLSKLLDLE